jgi:biotin carboxylase
MHVEMKKILIIGASYLQVPLIKKVRELGFESHVVAWEDGAVGKEYASKFYPISIVDKETILELAKRLKPDAVLSIASDLAEKTVNYVARSLGLVSNSEWTNECTSNKFKMREILSLSGILCPQYFRVTDKSQLSDLCIVLPVIVKPTDRSGSRGVTLVFHSDDLSSAVDKALDESFKKEVIIEQYIDGAEVSVESISQNKRHQVLTITDKQTTGSPHFVELGHKEPSNLSFTICDKIKEITLSILDITEIEHGASHTEFKIDSVGNVYLIEIGSRMGGDFIGSDLVYYSTGFDFVKASIEVSLGIDYSEKKRFNRNVAIRFFATKHEFYQFLEEYLDLKIIKKGIIGEEVKDLASSSDRVAYVIYYLGE